MPCELPAVRAMASRVRLFLASQRIPEPSIWACELALVEGCNNAVQYASPATRKNAVGIQVKCNARRIELRINDENQAFVWPDQVELPAAHEETGRGLFLIRSLMDRVEYVRTASSNCLVLQKNLFGQSGS